MTLKKIILVIFLFVLLVALPIVLVTDRTMEFYQELIDSNPRGSLANWAQLRIAGIYFHTMRPLQASRAYKKFLDNYPEDPSRKDALYYYAASLDEADKDEDSIEAFSMFLELYPDDKRAKDAQYSITRIKYIKR